MDTEKKTNYTTETPLEKPWLITAEAPGKILNDWRL